MKRLIGIIILVAGLILIGVSQHIKQRVAVGKQELSSAKENVGTGSWLFSQNPVTNEIGKVISGHAEKKISMGEDDIKHYTALANKLQIAGIILIVLGAGTILLFWRRR